MDKNSKMFIIYIAALRALKLAIAIHFSWILLLVVFYQDKTFTKISLKYGSYINVFLDLSMQLHENICINKHVIELVKGKNFFYKSIYSLGLVELEILKIYIETYLKTRLIQLSKSLIKALILLDKKINGDFCLYVNYQGSKILIIQNKYHFLLIGKFLDRLGCAQQFTQLNFTNAYHQIRIREKNE